jgi:hypothetical protein
MVSEETADSRSQNDFVEGEKFSLFVIPAEIVSPGVFLLGRAKDPRKRKTERTNLGGT